MRRSREDAANTRRSIVQAASRLFRARGIDSVSVADIMSSVGLTIGGFYKHFASKDALVAEAIAAASEETTNREGESAAALLDAYLSPAHRKNAERGCPVAALCSEVAHQGPTTKAAFTNAMQALIDSVAAVTRRGRRDVLYAASAIVGALVLSRATEDEELGNEILDAVRARVRRDHLRSKRAPS